MLIGCDCSIEFFLKSNVEKKKNMFDTVVKKHITTSSFILTSKYFHFKYLLFLEVCEGKRNDSLSELFDFVETSELSIAN